MFIYMIIPLFLCYFCTFLGFCPKIACRTLVCR